jgi:hypothetical protein
MYSALRLSCGTELFSRDWHAHGIHQAIIKVLPRQVVSLTGKNWLSVKLLVPLTARV